MQQTDDITRLLEDWRQGDGAASDLLIERIYGELERIAGSFLSRERRDHTLQTSALVHEAYLRLIDQQHVHWQNRAHFFGIAAQMMRRILVNHARDRVCTKRGGGAQHLSLDDSLLLPEERLEEYIAVDQALSHLAVAHPQQAKVVELRFFGGMTSEEIAEFLGLSVATVARRWRVARAWLYRDLQESHSREVPID